MPIQSATHSHGQASGSDCLEISPLEVSSTAIDSNSDSSISQIEPAIATHPQLLKTSMQVMSTAALVSHLQTLAVNKSATHKSNGNAAQLFKRIDECFLDQPMVVAAQSTGLPALKMKPRTLMCLFGVQLKIKGSAVQRLVAPGKGKINLKGLNDFDIAMPVARLDAKDIKRRLVQVIRQAKHISSHDALPKPEPLDIAADDELLKTYLRSWQEGNGYIKLRFNVAQDSIPLDLVLFKALAADFDTLQASAEIDVDLEKKIAVLGQVLTPKSQQWLAQHQLLWLHEQMDGGLPRIQKWFDKSRQGQLLQPAPLGRDIYQRDSHEHQAKFLVWLLARAPQACALPNNYKSLLRPIMASIRQLHDNSSPQEDEVQAQQTVEVLLRNMRSWTTGQESDDIYGGKLIQCVQIFSDCGKELAQLLASKPALLHSLSESVDQLLPRPTAHTLISLWKDQTVETNHQLAPLLGPISESRLLDADPASDALALRVVYSAHLPQQEQLDACVNWLKFHASQKTVNQSQSNLQSQPALNQQFVIKRAVGLCLAQFNQKTNTQKPGHQASIQQASIQQTIDDIPKALLTSVDQMVQQLQPKDVKLFKPILTIIENIDINSLSKLHTQFPELTQFLVYSSIQNTLRNGEIINEPSLYSNRTAFNHYFNSATDEFKVLKQCVNKSYVERSGVDKKNNIWFDFKGTYCILSAQNEYYFGAINRNKQNELMYHGAGLLFNPQLTTIISAQFNHGLVKDNNAWVATSEGCFCLPVADKAIVGKGNWLPYYPSKFLDATLAVIDPVFANALSTYQELDLKIAVHGQWHGTLNQVIQQPLGYLPEGFMTIEESEVIVEQQPQQPKYSPEIAGIKLVDGQPSSIELQSFRGHPELTLFAQFAQGSHVKQALSPNNIQLVRQTTSLPKQVLESILGTYNAADRQFSGAALIKYSHGKYVGGFDNLESFKAQGAGHFTANGEAYGRYVEMKQGVVFDQDLEALARGGDKLMSDYESFGKPTKLPLRPFQLPESPKRVYFSFQNQAQGKIYGQWRDNGVIGILKLSEKPSQRMIGSFVLANTKMREFLVHATSPSNSLVWEIALSGDGNVPPFNETFMDTMGRPVFVMPNGPLTISDTQTNQSIQTIYAFGRLMPEVVLQYPEDDFLVFRQKSDSAQFFVLHKRDTFYNVRVVDPDLAANTNWKAVTQNTVETIGTITSLAMHYSGEMNGLVPHGHGVRTDVEGTEQTGEFDNNKITTGRVSYANGVVIDGQWDKHKLNGLVTLELPFKKATVKFEGKMRGDQCITPLVSANESIAKGAINDGLSAYNLQLTPFQLQYLLEN